MATRGPHLPTGHRRYPDPRSVNLERAARLTGFVAVDASIDRWSLQGVWVPTDDQGVGAIRAPRTVGRAEGNEQI
jgi:hypothetical protein